MTLHPSKLLVLIVAALLAACTPEKEKATTAVVPTGIWRTVIQSPGGDLPFSLDISKKDDSTYTVYALNGKEKLKLDDAHVSGDSLRIPMDLFDSELVAKVADSTLTGWYTKYNPNRVSQMKFTAVYGQTQRFEPSEAKPQTDVSGKWSVLFWSEEDSTQAVGVFEQQGSDVTGTFLTPTGDYRYLAGTVQGSRFYLSCFDGTHVYLFKAQLDSTNNQMQGEFWSGPTGYEKWTATRNDKAALPDANQLTFLKKGYDALAFTFPNVETNQPVSLSDEKYKGKVVIVQLMGSWCPNCMDETRFLSPWYEQHKNKGVEVVALAYEKSPEFAVSAPKLVKMKKRFDVSYDVLLAGINDKEAATKSLPMIEKVLAFPSTIFVDRKGKVRKIHTGFSGPGTGKYYEEFVTEFNQFTDKLIAEK
jgi:thiol-disulfide isomerase/thioredoxin